MKTAYNIRSARAAAALLGLAGSAALLLPALADPTTQTQPTPPRFNGAGQMPVPPPVPVTPADAPPAQPAFQVGNPAEDRGFVYERRRIKRTVPVDPAAGVEGRWDLLYVLGQGTDRKAVYFDWDDDFLYFAAESAAPSDARFDIDATGDGWFRGADNLSFWVAPSLQPGGLPRVSAQRWDTVQNKDRPVWAESPVPVAELKVAAGRTPSGAYATLLAVPRAESARLRRKTGEEFGIRVDFGLPPAALDEASLYLPRPMLRVTLEDNVPARGEGLAVRVDAAPTQLLPGDGMQIALEVKNESKSVVRVARLFLRGSQAGQPFLDAATFTGVTLKPGEKIRRDLRSAVGNGIGLGAGVVTGGVELEGGTALAALASFDRVDPYSVTLSIDDRAVSAGSSDTKTVLVSVKSRDSRRTRGKVTLQLPPHWSVENGERQRGVSLHFAGDTRPLYYKIVVPAATTPGTYPLQADVQIGGRSYSAAGTVTVTRSVASP